MTRLKASIVIGIVCALVLTLIRGGWRDAPLVVPIFAVVGFSVSYVVGLLIGSAHIAKIERTSRKHRAVTLIRDAFAFMLVAVSFLWSGKVIQGAGYSGWLVALFLGVVFPLVVCLIASHWLILYGLFAATSLAVSTLLYNPDYRQDHFTREALERFWRHDAGVWLVIWGILAGLSLIVSIPLSLQRRERTNGRERIRGRES